MKEADAQLALSNGSVRFARWAAADRLKEYARNDASLNLEQIALPLGEEVTRKAIAATKKKQQRPRRLDVFAPLNRSPQIVEEHDRLKS